jgi:hypothetical protein
MQFCFQIKMIEIFSVRFVLNMLGAGSTIFPFHLSKLSESHRKHSSIVYSQRDVSLQHVPCEGHALPHAGEVHSRK